MASSSESQNTQQRPPRARRVDYHALNTGTDSEGDSDEGPRSRSRRRLEMSETSTVFSDDIISPDESASQILASDADRGPSLSPVIQRKPIPPKSWVWQHFHTTELETTYIYKATNKEQADCVQSLLVVYYGGSSSRVIRKSEHTSLIKVLDTEVWRTRSYSFKRYHVISQQA
ncbi:hypothetical protein V1523DRAFT_398905 [Lipomyces doorenjongii]